MEQLRMAALVVAILGLIVVFWVGCNHRRRAWYILPATLYLGHLALFYFVRVMGYQSVFGWPMTPENVNLWSVTIHIQAAMTITIKAVAMIKNGGTLKDA